MNIGGKIFGSIAFAESTRRSASGFRNCALFLLTALLSTACSSQPAMAPGHVARLHSGKLVINIPRDAVRVQSRIPPFQLLAQAVIITAITWPEFGIAMAPVDGMYFPSPDASPVLKLYGKTITGLPLSQDFRVLGSEVVNTVPWIKHSSALVILHEPDGISAGQMHHMIEKDNVNAIAFAQPRITFTLDMSALAMHVSIGVYAKGRHGAVFLDGGGVTASTSLEKSGAPLTADEMDDVDAGRGFINKVRAFRAKLWFANRGERFNIALAEDLRLIEQRLVNYLNGRRHA